MRAVAEFTALPEAAALAAANKRVANILAKQASGYIPVAVDNALLQEPAEVALAVISISHVAHPTAARQRRLCGACLRELAGWRATVDDFFDKVLANCDDARPRANRFALLARLREAFLGVADISLLAVSVLKFVLLDRDGVVNFDSDDYIRSADEWLPIPGSIEAIASLSRAGFEVVVVTNQSGLSRGFFGLDELEAMHAKMRARWKRRAARSAASTTARTCRRTTATAASRGPVCWTPSSRITVVPWQAASWWETP